MDTDSSTSPAPVGFAEPYIKIVTLTGKTIIVTNPHTVREVKEAIRLLENIPVEQQRLIYQGQTLEDDAVLKDRNIESGALLHLVLRLAKPIIYLSTPLQSRG